MQSACETGEVFALLEGRTGTELLSLYGKVHEGWLTRGLLQYHARTGSARALDVLARAPEQHARLLLDALGEELAAAGRAARARALAALAPLCARRPPWLHRLAAHPALRAVLRAARAEPEPAPRLHALLALAALAPPAPLPELADAVLRAAAAADPHLQLAAHALFHALYAAHPARLLEALRHECAAEGRGGEAARGALPALLETTRLHPALVLEEPPVVVTAPLPAPLAAVPPAPAPPSPAPAGSAAAVSRAAAALRPPTEPWFALGERCGADSAPHTPLPPDAAAAGGGEGGSPPEAAVEATPENTPAKESRAQFTFPTESSTVRDLGRLSQPPSPLRKESSPGVGVGVGVGGAVGAGGTGGGYAGRLARVVLDRAAAEVSPAPGARPSPVPFHGAPPPAAARPEPRAPHTTHTYHAHHAHHAPEEPEDREVVELTSLAAPRPGRPPAPPRALLAALRPSPRPSPRTTAARPAPPPRRAASCPPRAAAASRDAAVQTVETVPEPYEFIISDHFVNVNNDFNLDEEWSVKPHALLDAYLHRLYAGEGGAGPGTGTAEGALSLTHAALQYERWRREVQTEQCRRLLGRCRETRALEMNRAALRDRVRALQRDLDECRARLAAPRAAAAAVVPSAAAALEAELAAERAARLRAEAQLKEWERRWSEAQQESRALRGAAWEAARGGARLARAAAASERRTALLRRLRRELLVLAERDHALTLVRRSTPAAVAAAAAAAAGAEEETARRETAALRADRAAAAAEAEAAAARVAELEAALAAREAAAVELKVSAVVAAQQHAARLAALQDKYRALLHVQRRMEARRLDQLAGAPSPSAGAPSPSAGGALSPHSSPLSASLASGEGVALDACSRVRHLLEDDAPPPPPPPPPPASATPAPL